ncbi:MAG TPA: NAD(P)-dependent oxidoreductase, partial [Solirubrobacteraceae bacterium]|nr:NAD(P)-dependent oxidoreductase [Solirubrobacteraceae bacterium]
MRVLLHERIDPELLGDLPPEVEIVSDATRAEVIVEPREDLLRHLGRLPDLHTVLVLSAGTDWIEPHLPDGVTLANARGARDAAVAEWVVAATLAMQKRLLDQARLKRWDDRFLLPDVEGSTVLILGAGSIGEAVAARLDPFGVEIVSDATRAEVIVEPREDLLRHLGRLPDLHT